MRKTLIAAALAAPLLALAQATPAGLWKTVDDRSKIEKSLVRIVDQGGVLTGRVEKILDPSVPADERCTACTDARRNQPVVGLVIIRNAKRDADDPGLWTGGDILDPNDGKLYRLRLKPEDGGRTLQVRGYVGPFFRTQHWQRVE